MIRPQQHQALTVWALAGVLAGTLVAHSPLGWAGKEMPPAAATSAEKAYKPVTPLELVQNAEKYVNKRVAFEGTFSSFSSLGLDYKPAMRASKEFVSLLILRPDVSHHKIPLSELKVFYPREKSEAVMNLEAGDVIAIQGTVFSAALRDPWVDAQAITVVRKAKPDAEKSCTLDNC